MSNRKNKDNAIKKLIKSTNKITLILVCVFIVFGVLVGVSMSYFLMRGDVFEINGNTEIVLHVGDTYVEEGAKAIAFGKDISDSVKIYGTVDTTNQGEYVIKYTVDNFRFRGYVLYKLVTVTKEN